MSEEKDGFYMAEVEGNKGLVPVGHVGEYNPKHPVSSFSWWLLLILDDESRAKLDIILY